MCEGEGGQTPASILETARNYSNKGVRVAVCLGRGGGDQI